MKQTYSIDKNDRKQYPMGAVSVEGGMHISFASRAASCSLVLYRKGSKKPEAELAFPREGRQGDVWGMTVLGDFSEMEYTLKEDRSPLTGRGMSFPVSPMRTVSFTIFIQEALQSMPPLRWSQSFGVPLREWRKKFPT